MIHPLLPSEYLEGLPYRGQVKGSFSSLKMGSKWAFLTQIVWFERERIIKKVLFLRKHRVDAFTDLIFLGLRL